ncbi:MAG TPA: type II 3-dehydroquinate dehydratase [Dongiaceae bacterium]|nr:type II 3-dehydroquinate dehydratase [Dongiaceae bacterium]
MKRIWIINGPNLNLLGKREPHIYGTMTLEQLDALCVETGRQAGTQVSCRQSNHEGELIGWLHASRTEADGIILNPAGFGHSSVALLDAALACEKPVIEVHLSNIFRREAYRRHSYLSEGVLGVISGLGSGGYIAAVWELARRLGGS